MVNFSIVYELDSWPRDIGTNFTLAGCLFGAAKLAKNADPEKYVYSSYGIGFDTRIEYSLSVIIFRADRSPSVHIDNKEKRHLNSW